MERWGVNAMDLLQAKARDLGMLCNEGVAS